MVDHRADQDSGFRLYVNTAENESFSWLRIRETVKDWISSSAGRSVGEKWDRSVSSGSSVSKTPEQRSTFNKWPTLPIGLSALWIMAVGAYGAGYYFRVNGEAIGGNNLPTLELLFFCFAMFGPLAMIWTAYLMLSRAARLTAAIADQSDSANALAQTIANLNSSVEALSAGTTERLEEACTRMESETAQSAQTLERTLSEIVSKVDATILDSVILLDRSSRDRLDQIEAALAAERSVFADRLDDDASKMSRRIESVVNTTREQLDRQLEKTVTDQQSRLSAIDTELKRAMSGLVDTVDTAFKERLATLDHSVGESVGALKGLSSEVAERIQRDLVGPMSAIGTKLDSAAVSLATNPPASAKELADIVGDAAADSIRPERELLASNLGRITDLQKQASTLLEQIDKTSRLSPHISAPENTIDATHEDMLPSNTAVEPGLFNDLPRGEVRGKVNWTAALQLFDKARAKPGTKHLMEATRKDPDISGLLLASDAVVAVLAEEAIYPEDLRPEHASARTWFSFARGVRGGDISTLSGIEDDITLAIVRARLRSDVSFRSQALRFIDAYIDVLSRAADDLGADSRLVEMAETKTGRCFLLLSQLTGLFDQALPTRFMPED